ncbi:MAG: diguanylate cyclase [Desulfovibrio sp.]|nr:diguanylate cyclase [Desulfovibrio sp.]
MEIVNSTTTKRKILLISGQVDDLTELRGLLSKHYAVVSFKHTNEDCRFLKEQANNTSAIIICASVATANDYAMLKWIYENGLTDCSPVLIYCCTTTDFTHIDKWLGYGAIDIISLPLHENAIFNRIDNAIRLKDSTTFYDIEKMLKELPSNIYLKDSKGKYIFATHYWHHLDNDNNPEWSIRGKTDLEIRKDKENAKKAFETDIEILNTGIGKRYIIEVNTDGKQEFLEIIKEPLKDLDGKVTGIIALINDITEKENMRMQLEKLALKDGLTGLRNNKAYSIEIKRIDKEISERTANFGIAMVDLNFLKQINDKYGHEYGNKAILALSKILCDIFKHSPVFRFGGDEFIILLENNDLQNINILSNQFRNIIDQNRFNDDLPPWEKISAAIGIAIFDKKRDVSATDVFKRADGKMYECKLVMKAALQC